MRPGREATALEQVFGADHLARLPEERLPATVTDPGARAFLTGIGLPTAPGAVIRADEGLAAGQPSPLGGAMLLVGRYGTARFVLDGSSGAVHALLPGQDPTAGTRPAHRDPGSLVRCLLAFGGRELWLLSDLMDPDTADWCREHLPGFAELCPVRDEEDDLLPDEEDDDFLARLPDADEVLAELTARLRQIEPQITDQPVWQAILRDFRHGY
ncbi:SUKH-4 family immunity protein [Kitasatospora sp. NPDC048365]|uniref:SUKH-4 family immunity protein n=1 Tax=Kitasatospora sp. NPDC048365 TaxID=3364050 RepID=UPI00371CECC7